MSSLTPGVPGAGLATYGLTEEKDEQAQSHLEDSPSPAALSRGVNQIRFARALVTRLDKTGGKNLADTRPSTAHRKLHEAAFLLIAPRMK